MQVSHRRTLASCLRGKVYRLHIGCVFPCLDEQGMVQKECLRVVWGVRDDDGKSWWDVTVKMDAKGTGEGGLKTQVDQTFGNRKNDPQALS